MLDRSTAGQQVRPRVGTDCHIQAVAAGLEAPKALANRIAGHPVAVGDAVGSAAQTAAEVRILVLKVALVVDSLALPQMEDRHSLAVAPEVDTSVAVAE